MCSSRAECYLVLIAFTCIVMSLMVAVPVFILTYPGDECLLFISVRGEALIYGNPAGCNFMAYGHCVIILGVLLLLFLLFCRNRKGFPKRRKDLASTRTLRSTNLLPAGSGGNFNLGLLPSLSMNTVQQKHFARLYSVKVIMLCAFLAMFTIVSALVIVSGYIVSCNELHYETRRQVYGRTTLGTPLKHFSIACYSLFRDVDFHSRFHFDHYEYSGQWHGQYRGYQHGRVHQYNTKHEHMIEVATALEMAIAGACISSLLWVILLTMLIYLRIVQKKRKNRELAESIEDARIYATSLEQMNMKPMDQMSITSQQSSSILSQKPPLISSHPSGMTSPVSHDNKRAMMETPLHPTQQQQMTQQRLHQSQPNLDGQAAQNGVQYVQLTNGLLVPVSSIQLQQQQQQLDLQQEQMRQLLQQYHNNAISHAYAQIQPSTLRQQQQQQQQQQLQQQQMQLQQQQQLLHQQMVQQQNLHQSYVSVAPSVVSNTQPHQQQQHPPERVRSPTLTSAQRPATGNTSTTSPPSALTASPKSGRTSTATINLRHRRSGGFDMQDGEAEEPLNSVSAQRKQVDLSNDLGLKCSQI